MPTSSTRASVRGARLELLKALGFATLQHDSHVPFLSHLLGTRRLLAAWGERPALCDAGLFHSVYGTEYFEPDRMPTRKDVIAIIGAEAERIAWLWCAIRRDTIDVSACAVRLRAGEVVEPLTSSEVGDLATLWAADTVEQVARMEPDERMFSHGLLTVLGAASEPAQRAVEAISALLD
jgi:hypothetical protein